MTLSPHAMRRALIGVSFPADTAALRRHVRQAGAPADVVDTIGRLPDRSWRDAGAVAEVLAQPGAART